MSSVSGFTAHVRNFPSEVNMLGDSRSLTVIAGFSRLSDRFEIVSVNIQEYFAGLLLMSKLYNLALPHKPILTLRILDANNYNNYELLSLLSGFQLSLLPIELLSQILSYYPADWYLVSKDFYNIVRQELISDKRIKYDARINNTIKMIRKDHEFLSKRQNASIVELINQASSYDQLSPLLGRMWEGMELLMKAITNRILSLITLSDYINDTNMVAISSIPYFDWFFDNYDDAYYVADARKVVNYLGNKGAFAPEKKFPYLFLNRIILTNEFSVIFNVYSGMDSKDSMKMIKDIMSNNGRITKTATNPLTGKTKEGYVGNTIDINIGGYAKYLIDYIRTSEGNREAAYMRFIDTILYLIKNYGNINGYVSRHGTLLEVFLEISDMMTDTIEVVEYLNFVLPFVEIKSHNTPLLRLLLGRLARDPNRRSFFRVRTLKEEAEAVIAPLEEILIRREYFKYFKYTAESIDIFQVRKNLTETIQNLEEGELRSRYQRVIDYMILISAIETS
jgi:hypothetical protein